MFKKIDIWVLYLTVMFSVIFAVGFGVLVRQELVGSVKAGWISKGALNLAEIPVNVKRLLKDQSDELAVEDRFPRLDGFDGTAHEDEAYLLLSRYDFELREGVVELVDLTNFNVLHTWNPDINAFNSLVDKSKEFRTLAIDRSNARSLLMHPHLTRDAELYFGWAGPLHSIDSCSNLVRQHAKDAYHHAIETDIQGNIWASSYIYPQSLAAEKVGRDEVVINNGYQDDGIVKLSSKGEILFEKSVSQILIEHGLEYLIFAHGDDYEKDPIHLNDIQPVNHDGQYWRKGDVFLSLRNLSMIVLYRPSTNEIIWRWAGPFFHQHDVDILDHKRISIFNNNKKLHASGPVVDGTNEVTVYDFSTGAHSSYLEASLVRYDVKTINQGLSEILPNGDLFVEETNYGRTLYFNADGSLRWTHLNRATNGKVYQVGWSRIMATDSDVQTVREFLKNKADCDV